MVVSKDYPYLEVKVTVRNLSSHFQALLDTGFDGYLILPEVLNSQLGKPDFQVKTGLADGSARIASEYRGRVEIVGLNVLYLARIILLGDECLMGQGIIKRLKVTFDHGIQVVVEP
jgi:predicted aspartyl protease